PAMPNPTDKAYFVELNDFSIVLARSSALRSSVVIEDIREVPLDNKAGLEEAVQAVFPETKSGTTEVFAALRPKQRGLHLSSADEGKKFATLSALPGVLSEPALANFSPGEFTAVYAGNGLTISGQGAPWLLAAAAKDSYAEALATLQGLKLVPSRISPATLSAAGSLASALKLKADGSTALLFEFGEFCTHLLLVSRDGVEAVRSVPVTMDKVAEAVQVELGLKFKGSAAKLFFNDSYDFSETGTKIAARIAQELTADISAIGHTPAALACTGLPAKQNWFATSLAGALNLAPFAPDLKSWCEQTHLVIPDSTVESSLTPAWLGFLYLIGSYQPASPEKSVWQPDWTRSTPPPAPAAAPAPAVVIAPAAVIAPPKPAPVVPAAVVPPVAPAKPAPFAFTPMPPKPATPGAAVPPAKPAAAVPPAAPAKPFAFTPTPPKPVTPAAIVPPAKPATPAAAVPPAKPAAVVPPAAPAKPAPAPFTPTPPKPAAPAPLPVKPAAPAPAKPAAPPAKPLAAPPPRPIAAPPPRPVAAPAPVKPATPAPKPSLAKPAMASASSSAKPGFLKSTTGMIVIACAVLALAAAGYFVYDGQQKAAVAAEHAEKERRAADEAAKAKQLADQKAHDEAVLKKAQEDAAAKLAAAEAAANAAEEQARFETAAHIAAARGQINVTTEPTGALVTIGDLPPRTAPTLFPNLKLGHYPVTVALRSYETAKLDLEVKENETTDPGVIKLTRQTGSLDLTSDPPGVTYNVRSNSDLFHIDLNAQGSSTTTIVNENWSSGVRSKQNPPDSLAWFCSSTPSNVSVSNNSVTVSTAAAHHLVAYFPRQKLNAGDTLTLTFKCSLGGPLQAIGTSSGISLKAGLFDSNNSFIYTADSQQSGNPVTYVGYITGTGFNLQDDSSPSALTIRRRSNLSGNLITSNAGLFSILPGKPPEKQSFQPDTTYTGTISVQMVSSTEVRISASYSGDGLNNYSTTATDRAASSGSIVSSFDAVAFAIPSVSGQTAARSFTLYNVELARTTPGGGLSGTTPATLGDLPAGDYTVTFSREGFPSHSETVSIERGTTAHSSWKFTNGNVIITSDPSGAKVTTSDGQILGLTPVTINDVPPSDVSYTVSLDGYDPVTLSGKAEGGTTTTLDATLLSVDRLAKLSELDVRPQPVTQEGPELPPSISESGEVDVAITVDRSGNPRDPKVVKNTTNNPEIARLCLAAIAKWKFKPGIIDDKPVNVRVTEPFAINP
ncbi:MAG TPA: PEGA domain-containing protein, partial [Opitutaceae bacterium]|nr:PEGA domain-containing protein [Opitutaceae bacterium]